MAILHLEERFLIALFGPDATLLPPHYVAPIGSSTDGERVPATSFRQPKIDADAEVLHGYRCPTAYFPKATPFPQRAIQREMQRVRGKSEYVQKVALPRTIAADDYRQRAQRDIACCNAPEVERRNPRDRDRLSHRTLAP